MFKWKRFLGLKWKRTRDRQLKGEKLVDGWLVLYYYSALNFKPDLSKKKSNIGKKKRGGGFREQRELELFDVVLTSSFYCQLSPRKLFHLREIQILRKLKFQRSAAWKKKECGRKKINGGRSMLIEISWTLNRYRHDDEKEREGAARATDKVSTGQEKPTLTI